MSNDFLTFRLDSDFVESYRDRPVRWGFQIGGGNSLGELTYISKYSRRRDDGTKERWFETCERVIEGMYTILKNHCDTNRTPWNHHKAQRSAQEAYERMFEFKWTPPGRGLWMMGTAFIHEKNDSSALQNCAMVSTEKLGVHEPTLPFVRLMEMSMLGIGVGFDTRGVSKLTIHVPDGQHVQQFVIPDSREGWCDSVDVLLRSYFLKNKPLVEFDYSEIRPAGSLIKGFGGVAAGPGPLMDLHVNLRRLFDGRDGQQITSSDIVDVMNLVGKCVVSGNVRRSAEIALGDSEDKSFLDLKDWNVNPERMSENGWGHVSNNSVFAEVGGSYDHLVERIANNGEPGLVYLDLLRQYGRLIDAPNGRDYRAVGVNPCVSGETMVMTTEGPRRADALLGRPFWAVVNGKAFHSRTGMYVTRTADLHRLQTKEGYSLLVTGNHEIRTADGRMIAAEDLVAGDSIQINNHRDVGGWDGKGSEADGYLLGSFLGDGGWENNAAVVKVWEKDSGSSGIRDALLFAAQQIKHRSDWAGWRDHGRGYEVMTLPPEYLKSWGIARRSKSTSDELEATSSAFHVGFVRGLFDSDGHVEGWREADRSAKGGSVRLSQVDRGRLEMVQRMLLRLGIKSRIYLGRAAGSTDLPGGTYECQPVWRLVVSSSDLPVFAERVNFCHIAKAEKLSKIVSRTKFYSKPFVATVISFDYERTDVVYDCTVDELHLFDANGLVVSNCAEQSLEHLELCTLVETYPVNNDDLDDFIRTLKFAYLYAKAVTLLPTRWPDTNEVMQRNRRIGCSVSGLAQFGERYNYTELRTWLNKGFEAVEARDRQYSEWLGVRESIKKTSVKPSGTVSLLAGVTPGVHWPIADTYIRRMRFAKNDPMVEVLAEAGYFVEPSFADPDYDVVVEFPTRGPSVRTEKEVSVWEKAALAVLAQRYWADNQVSATFTFSESEKDQVGPVIRTFEGQLKSISFLPLLDGGAYRQMPYERISDDQCESLWSSVRTVNWDRVYDDGIVGDAEGEKFCTNDTCEVKL